MRGDASEGFDSSLQWIASVLMNVKIKSVHGWMDGWMDGQMKQTIWRRNIPPMAFCFIHTCMHICLLMFIDGNE